MTTILMLLASLAAAQGQPSAEAECKKLYPDDQVKLLNCLAPIIDPSSDEGKEIVSICMSIRAAVKGNDVYIQTAKIFIRGKEYTCEYAQ